MTTLKSTTKLRSAGGAHLEALLLGPPLDEHVLVQEAPCLGPDSGISSGHRLHAAGVPHLDDVRTSARLTKAGLGCRKTETFDQQHRDELNN